MIEDDAPIEIDTPDGGVAEFPAGTSPDVIKAVLQKKFGAPGPVDRMGAGIMGPQMIGEGMLGAARGLGGSVAGLGELVTRSPMLPTYNKNVSEGLSNIRKQLHDTPPGPQTVMKNVEQIGEFMVPGAAGMKVPKLATGLRTAMLQGAAEGGLVGSIQAGKPNPTSAVTGGLFAGGAKLTGEALKSIAKFLTSAAERRAASLVPAAAGHQGKVTTSVKESLAKGEFPVGNIDDIAAQAGTKADAAGAASKVNRKAERATTVNIDDIIQSISDEVSTTVTKNRKGPILHDETLLAKLQPLVQKLQEIRAKYGNTGWVPSEVLEKQRKAFSKMYVGNPDVQSAAAPKLIHDKILKQLDIDVPNRQSLNREFNLSKEFSTAATKAAERASKGTPSGVGEAGALRATMNLLSSPFTGGAVGGSVGLAIGGPAGAAVGAISVPAVANFLKSPLFRSWSAAKQYNFAQQLAKLGKPEEAQLVMSALGGRAGVREEEGGGARVRAEAEVQELLRAGDKAGARQRALQYKRETGDRIDTRELEMAVSGVRDDQ